MTYAGADVEYWDNRRKQKRQAFLWSQKKEQDKFFKKVREVAGEMAPDLARYYNSVKKKCGQFDANSTLAQFRQEAGRLSFGVGHWVKKLGKLDLQINFAGTNDELCIFAQERAAACARLISGQSGGLKKSLCASIKFTGIELTRQQKSQLDNMETPILERLKDEKWWRRKVKTRAYRVCEQILRELGHTRRGRGVYVSDFTMRRFINRDLSNQNLLQSLDATNEIGESFTLADIWERTVSNPEKRVVDLTIRARGFEDYAQAHSEETWRGMFYTWTCPSAFHPCRSIKVGKGDKAFYKIIDNKKYQGFTPKEAMDWLNGAWQKARAEIARQKIPVFGFRVVEPHHDGTPHWHMMLIVPRARRKALTAILRRYVTPPKWSERGQRRARFDAVVIDPRRGGITGYLIKYIGKNITGKQVGLDYEAQDWSVVTALRVRAWASCWGIRQFQQIGGPPVTVYRELRRLARAPERIPPDCYVPQSERDVGFMEHAPEQLRLAIDSADCGDFKKYTEVMGGVCKKRIHRPFSLCYLFRVLSNKQGKKTDDFRPNRYGESVKYIAGLWTHFFVFPLRTRVHEWVIKLKGFDPSHRKKFGKRDLFLKASDSEPLEFCH